MAHSLGYSHLESIVERVPVIEHRLDRTEVRIDPRPTSYRGWPEGTGGRARGNNLVDLVRFERHVDAARTDVADQGCHAGGDFLLHVEVPLRHETAMRILFNVSGTHSVREKQVWVRR